MAAAGTFPVTVRNTTTGVASNAVDFTVTAATATPTITIGTLTPAGSFSTVEGTASAIKTYTLAGSNLTANLTVGPLAGYEFSTDGFATAGAASLSLAPTSGTVSVTVSVRLAATATAVGSPYNGDIANASTGATTRNVTVSGTVTAPVPVPTITNLTPGNGPVGTAVTITGTDLTGATAVTLNGVTVGTYTVVNATTITFTVSAGATTGTIAVTTPGGTATSATFTVDPTPAVVTGAITPASVQAGNDVTVAYTTTGTFNSGNVFSALLSNASGGFGSGTTALTTTAVTTGALVVTIPAGTTPGTAYLIRVNASNPVATGSNSTNTLTVTAVPVAPTVTTTAASAITATTASSGGNVTSAGSASVTARGVVYGTSPNPRIGGSGVTAVTGGTGIGSFTSSLTSLTSNTTYYVAAYATNSVGTTYGADETFMTTVAPATPLLNYDFAASNAVATSSNANVSGAAFTPSAGLSPSGSSQDFRYTGFTPAFNTARYFEFQVTVAAGSQANLTQLTLLDRATSTGPVSYELRSSLDNFTNTIGTVQTPNGSATGVAYATTKTISFSNTPALASVTGTVTFRIFGYGASAGGGSFGVDDVNLYGSVTLPSSSVTAPTFTGTAFCAGGAAFSVNFTSGGTFNAGNSFVVQLSDAAGAFGTTPTVLATLTNSLAAAQTASVTIPAATANGTAYRLRVVSTDPAVTSANSVAVTVVNSPTVSITPNAAQTLVTNTNGTTLTANETPAAVSRQWYTSATSGGTTTLISGATGATYTPNFATAGTYYVTVVSTFAACGTATSNEVLITVTAPVATLTATPTSLSFSATVSTTATAASYVLTGSNLTPGATVSIAAQNAAFQVSTTSATAGFAATQSATVSGSGTLSQTVYVRFIAPATTGVTTSSIANTVGALSAPVAVEGTATAVPVAGAPGTLLFEDDFDYAVNQPLTSRGWEDVGSPSTPVIATATGNNTSSTYPLGIALNASPVGTSTRASLVPSGQDLIKTPSVLQPFVTTLYAAAVINVSNAQNSGDYFLSFYNSRNTTVSYRHRVSITKLATGTFSTYSFSLTGENGTVFTSTTPFNRDTNYLLVLKVENSAATGNLDVTSLYVLPVDGDVRVEPTPLLTTTSNTNLAGTLNTVALRQGGSNSPSLTIDGLRLATGWGAAIGRPIYTAPSASIGAGNYYDVAVNNGDVLTPVGSVSIEGNLTLTSGKINTTAANSILLYPTATVSGGSATSFVNGPLSRFTTPGASNAAIPTVFPIGKGLAYRPLTLTATAQTAATTYTAEQMEIPVGQGQNNQPAAGAALKRVSTKRFYTVTSSNATAGNFTGTVTLSFGSDDYVNVPSSMDLVVAKRDAPGPWASIGHSAETGGTGTAGGPYVAGTITSASFSNFSDFTLGALNPVDSNPLGATNPLPVELTSFTAQRQAGSAVSVQWTTASEHNSARFEVQRSLDGFEFGTVATAAAQGNATQPTAYAALDKTAPTALLYYRLRQVDQDGTLAYSPVVTVVGSGTSSTDWTLYPNPTTDRLTLALPAATGRTYRVLNTLGQEIAHGKAADVEPVIDVRHLPAGTYFLELHTVAGPQIKRFVKND